MHTTRMTVGPTFLLVLTHVLVSLVQEACRLTQEEDAVPLPDFLAVLFYLAIAIMVYIWALRVMARWCLACFLFPFRCFADCCRGILVFLAYVALNAGCLLGRGMPQDVCLLVWIVIELRWLYRKLVTLFGLCCWWCALVIRLGLKVEGFLRSWLAGIRNGSVVPYRFVSYRRNNKS